jgi:hypothetical protein
MTEPLSIEGLQLTIGYLYLLSFCPPGRIKEFQQAGEPLRVGLALSAGMNPAGYFARSLPEACRRIVAFHQRTREPDEDAIRSLLAAARVAHASRVSARAFAARMDRIAALPGRAKPDNRLRRNKGCQFCHVPCRYGFFALASKPDYDLLQQLIEAETQKSPAEQDPVGAAWRFATGHLWRTLGSRQGYVSAVHLGNLAYCLMTLGMNKARHPLPGAQFEAFQSANQQLIDAWPVEAA